MNMPVVLKGTKVVCYDCDDTLVMWNNDYEWGEKEEGTLPFEDPYFEERIINLKPNFQAINRLKKHHKDGNIIVVWSAGGCAWAEEVVRVLELQRYVSLIMSKPNRYIDDKKCIEWMGTWEKVNKNGSIGESNE